MSLRRQFLISSEDCVLLRACAGTTSLREAARVLDRDPAGLQRRIANLAQEHNVIEKINSRWVLTSKGRSLLEWTETSLRSQEVALGEPQVLRIATLPWIADTLLRSRRGPFTVESRKRSQALGFQLLTAGTDFETEILSGTVDHVITCHPPQSPSLAHKRLCLENWVCAVPASWRSDFQGLSFRRIARLLEDRPCIQHRQLHPTALFPEITRVQVGLTVDTLASTKAAIEAGIGWGVLPELYGAQFGAGGLALLSSIASRGHVCLWWRRHDKDASRHGQALFRALSAAFHRSA